jgi:hypothetical protein
VQLELLQGLDSVAGNQRANAVIVFDEENSFLSGYRRHGCLDDRQHGARLSDARKIHGDRVPCPSWPMTSM